MPPFYFQKIFFEKKISKRHSLIVQKVCTKYCQKMLAMTLSVGVLLYVFLLDGLCFGCLALQSKIEHFA